MNGKHPKIGLALGCGGAKGLAHIGVLKAFEEENIPISFIAGSSIGAWAGGVYAAFGSTLLLEETMLKITKGRFFSLLADPSLLREGFLSGRKFWKFLDGQLGGISFEDLKIPFAAVATDMKTGREFVIREGSLSKAIRASTSVPLVFNPVEYEGKFLADGGLSNPVPDDVARKMGADYVIAVNLDNLSNDQTGYINSKKKLNLYSVATISLYVMRCHLAEYCIKDADLTIEPNLKDVGLVGWSKFISSEKDNMVRAGEEAARQAIEAMKKDKILDFS